MKNRYPSVTAGEPSTTLAKRLFIHPDEANGLLSEGVQIDCRDMLGDPQEAHTHRYRFGNEENMNKPRWQKFPFFM